MAGSGVRAESPDQVIVRPAPPGGPFAAPVMGLRPHAPRRFAWARFARVRRTVRAEAIASDGHRSCVAALASPDPLTEGVSTHFPKAGSRSRRRASFFRARRLHIGASRAVRTYLLH